MLQSKELYYSIKECMEGRGASKMEGVEPGGEFPIEDMASGEGGLIHVCLEGVGLLFVNSKVSSQKHFATDLHVHIYINILKLHNYYIKNNRKLCTILPSIYLILSI